MCAVVGIDNDDQYYCAVSTYCTCSECTVCFVFTLLSVRIVILTTWLSVCFVFTLLSADSYPDQVPTRGCLSASFLLGMLLQTDCYVCADDVCNPFSSLLRAHTSRLPLLLSFTPQLVFSISALSFATVCYNTFRLPQSATNGLDIS